MIKLLKNAEVYNPIYIGIKDILIINDIIAAIDTGIHIKLPDSVDFEAIDCTGKLVVPGFIDGHVHLIGGGGEGGYQTRTPEVKLEDITTGGVTTVIGCLGTDGVARNMEALYAKAKALEQEGITTYILSGSYRLPILTITDSIMKDLMMIDKVIGAGEIALSDHRSCQPTMEQLKHLAADTRVGGILSGKAGIICLHIGSGSEMLNHLKDIVNHTELPFDQFIPTHINRNKRLLEEGIIYAKSGGYIDFTTSSNSTGSKSDDISASKSFKTAIESGTPKDKITFTSDGQGSLPIFDSNNQLIKLEVGKVKSLHQDFVKSVFDESIDLQTALMPITSTPALLYKLKSKGVLKKGNDADLVILEKKTLQVDTVIAMGKTMVSNKKIIVQGTFSQELSTEQ